MINMQLLLLMTVTTLLMFPYPSLELRFITFNTGLFPNNNYMTRLANITDGLESSDADVLCLQELWSEKHIKEVARSLERTYQYSWSFVHDIAGNLPQPQGQGVKGCTRESFGGYAHCVKSSCASAPDPAVCSMEHCTISDRCRECAINSCMNILGRSARNITAIEICMGQMHQSDYCHTWMSGSGGHNATNGLLLLSKLPLSQHYRESFGRSIVPHGFLKATVGGQFEVSCAHLTSLLRGGFMDKLSGYNSYEEQNKAQLQTILEGVTPGGIVMGDLNTGPAVKCKGIVGVMEDNFKLIAESGMSSVNVEKCTFCADNKYAAQLGAKSSIKDHILTSNSTKPQVEGVQVFHNGFKVGDNFETLSDHYPVCAQIRIPGL